MFPRLTYPSTAVGLAMMSIAAPVSAEETRQAASHKHGVSNLNVALEADSLLLELEAPAADIVGFEHAPKSEEQTQAVEQALAQLKDPESLFVPAAGAGCTLTSARSAVFGAIAEGEDADSQPVEDHDHDHDHGEGEAGDDHDHDHPEDDHDHDHDSHGSEHSEFYALSTWACTQIEKLDSLGLPFFGQFQNSQTLRVRIATDTGQTERVVDKEQTSVQILPLE